MDEIMVWKHIELLRMIAFALGLITVAVLSISIYLEFRLCFRDMRDMVRRRKQKWK